MAEWRSEFETLALEGDELTGLWDAVADLEEWDGSVRLPADSELFRLEVARLDSADIREAVVALTEFVAANSESWRTEGREDALHATDALLAALGAALKRPVGVS